jgi:hypothetical protein
MAKFYINYSRTAIDQQGGVAVQAGQEKILNLSNVQRILGLY